MNDCIFCKIINKELPCFKVYENEYVLAFLDINPILKGHTLVIPKKHSINVFDTDDFYLSEVIKVVKLLSNNIKQKLNCDGVNLLNASGKAAEQSVLHLHFHILPRYDNDKLTSFPITNYVKEDLVKIQEKLKID